MRLLYQLFPEYNSAAFHWQVELYHCQLESSCHDSDSVVLILDRENFRGTQPVDFWYRGQ